MTLEGGQIGREVGSVDFAPGVLAPDVGTHVGKQTAYARRSGDVAAARSRMSVKIRRYGAGPPKTQEEAAGLREAQVVLTALRSWLARQERSLEDGTRRSDAELIIFRSLVERAE